MLSSDVGDSKGKGSSSHPAKEPTTVEPSKSASVAKLNNMEEKGAPSGLPSSFKAPVWEASMINTKGKEGFTMDPTRSWSQIVQGVRRFRWESTRATMEDIESLEGRF